MTIRIRIMRHHHVAVELCPNNEASPRDLRKITLTRGTTTWPSWNYVLALRHHHDTRVELRPYVEAPPWTPTMRFIELSPIGEAPPGTLIRRVHGITSNRWGTTMSSHYKSHGITPYSHIVYVSPTNQKFS